MKFKRRYFVKTIPVAALGAAYACNSPKGEDTATVQKQESFRVANPNDDNLSAHDHVHCGAIYMNWSNKLGGMQIKVLRSKGSNTTTELVGRINDQTALSSILNTLYNHHFSIISVKKLKEKS